MGPRIVIACKHGVLSFDTIVQETQNWIGSTVDLLVCTFRPLQSKCLATTTSARIEGAEQFFICLPYSDYGVFGTEHCLEERVFVKVDSFHKMADNEKQMYDDVAGDYDIIWAMPAVRILWTLLDQNLQQLGDWNGAQVLDLACGTGIGLREARKFGAKGLVGIDISKEMIEVCKATTKDVDHFQLHVADCSQSLDHLGLQPQSFDLVIGMWLLNYAESASQLEGFWSNIAKYLKPNGTFLGIIQNQEKFQPDSMKTLKYGARESNIQPLPSGDGVKMHVEFDTVPKVEFDTYVLKKEIFEGTAAKAGLKILKYVKPDKSVLSEEEQKNIEWWQELLDEYPNQLVIATGA